MTYSESLEFMYDRLPMFQRIGAAAYKADLSVTIDLCQALSNPQIQFPSVHIAGTNGKGSVSHITASALQQSGYRTGLFTSPHLRDYRERMRINGMMIPESFVAAFVESHQALFEALKPSFFEMTYAMACSWFASENVDIVVMETGMGGRLDSTNTCRPVVSVITNISADHKQFLGETLPLIAAEKAGIIRAGIPVVIGQTQHATDHVFTERSSRLGCQVFHADQHFQVSESRYDQASNFLQLEVTRLGESGSTTLHSPLPGVYQSSNIVTALMVSELLPAGGFQVTPGSFKSGLEKVVENTGIAGRWQKIGDNPLTICDTGHNEDGIRQVLNQLSLMSYAKLHFVLGMVADKDIHHILSMLPSDAVYYFCRANIPRALDAETLAAEGFLYGLTGTVFPSVSDALNAARKSAAVQDLVLVGGSTFVVAEAV